MVSVDHNSIIVWAAGLFEGEGTITINSHGVRCLVTMTDLDVLETLQKHFPGTLKEQAPRKGKPHYKKQWRWSLTSTETSCKFLQEILPFLHKRRSDRAREALQWNELRLQKKHSQKEARNLLLMQIKELGKTNLTHKEIAIKLDIDRSYVSYTLSGKYTMVS